MTEVNDPDHKGKEPVSAKAGFGCLSILIGIVLGAIGVYVHFSTTADIPAAAMTERLQWSGWGWGMAGIVLLWIGFKLQD